MTISCDSRIALVLAQRLGEWVGHGPVLEEDIALTNVGLDLLGQARLWFAYAGEVEARFAGAGRSEDALAFLRNGGEFRNLLLVEQPNGNYADTIARQFYFDAWHRLLLAKLTHSRDARIAEIAAKAEKEVTYHVERSADWVIRLGDGTAKATRNCKLRSTICGCTPAKCSIRTRRQHWPRMDRVRPSHARAGVARGGRSVLDEATLTAPSGTSMQRGGKNGVHTSSLGHAGDDAIVAEDLPGAQW